MDSVHSIWRAGEQEDSVRTGTIRKRIGCVDTVDQELGLAVEALEIRRFSGRGKQKRQQADTKSLHEGQTASRALE
jgi:hypothetical protein